MTFGRASSEVKAGAFTRQTLWSAAGGLLPMAVTLALTPWLLHHLGRDRYALWVLVTTMQSLVISLDGGAAAAVLRYAALFRRRADPRGVTGLVLTLTLVSLALGVVVGLLALAISPSLPDWLREPAALRADTTMICATLGLTVGPLPATAVLQADLASAERFRAITAQALSSQLLFALLALALVPGHGLRGLVVAAIACRALVLTMAAYGCRGLHRDGRARRLTGVELRAIGLFAWRSQLAGAFGVINLELDALVVAALLPVGQLAVYGIAASVATGLRTVPLTFATPIYARLANDAGATPDDPTALETLTQLQREWGRWVLGYSAISTLLAAPAVIAWLGGGWADAAAVAAVLCVGHCVNILTAPLSAWARGVGRPDVEARYSAVSTVINLAATLPLTAAFGLVGLVGATVAGQVVGSLIFPILVRRGTGVRTPHLTAGLPFRRLGRGVPWVLVGTASLWIDNRLVAMVVVGVAGLAGLVAYAGRRGLVLRLDAPALSAH